VIKIETVDNGYLLTDERDPEHPNKLVVECDCSLGINPTKKDLEAFCNLLWRLTHMIGPTTSRYSPHRVHISLKRGDKYEPQG